MSKMFVFHCFVFINFIVATFAAGSNKCLRVRGDTEIGQFPLANEVGEPKPYGKAYSGKMITCIQCNDHRGPLDPEILQGGYGCDKFDLKVAINAPGPAKCIIYGKLLGGMEKPNCV